MKFATDIAPRERESRRRAEFRRSLDNPHPETLSMADAELEQWADNLPEEDTHLLMNMKAGTPIYWVPDKGWKDGYV